MKTYRHVAGGLLSIGLALNFPAPAFADAMDEPELANTSWRLVEIAEMDDSTHVPDDRSKYTLEFGDEGEAFIRSDCNRGSGSWTSESPGQLRFGPIATTMALCPPPTLHDVYLAQFEWVRSYVLRDGHLFLATMADGSIVEFEPLPVSDAVATVLGEPVDAGSAQELQALIIGRLFDQYARERNVRVSDEEVEAWNAHMDAVRKADQAEKRARISELDAKLGESGLVDEERAKLQRERDTLAELLDMLEGDAEAEMSEHERDSLANMRETMARSMVKRWKLNKAFFEEFGGRVIFQQLGPEPLDAYRAYLEQRQAAGDFAIHDPAMADAFWGYFTDERRHEFMTPEQAAEAFQTPPWQRSIDG